MRKGIAGQVVVITGASSGIGRGTALKSAQEGAALVLTARRAGELESVSRQCSKQGAQVLVVPGDVADLHHVEEVARRAIAHFGRIDIWLNNAGLTLFGRFEEVPYEDLRRVIETNLFGYIHGARAAIPYFREQGSGTLINVSSMVGHIGQPFTSAYTISKWGIQGLTESLRTELQDAPGINICAVLPPSVDTPLFNSAANFSGRAIKPLDPVYSADTVINSIISVMKKPRREVLPGGAAKQMNLLRTVAPALAERMFGSMVPKKHFQDRPAENTHGNLYEPMQDVVGVSGGWIDSPITTSNRQQAAKGALAGVGLLGLGIGLYAMMAMREKGQVGRVNHAVEGERYGQHAYQ